MRLVRCLAVLVLAGPSVVALGSTTGPATAPARPPTPAERIIASAREAVRAAPGRADFHDTLAAGLLRRARETADPSYYAQAALAVESALRIEPKDWEARRLRVQVLYGQGEYANALKEAESLSKQAPDDLWVAVFLADIHLALGNYTEAEQSAQWSLDLRRGNAPGLIRGAALREAFGDVNGAIDFLAQAMHSVADGDTDERAWLLAEMARLELLAGKTDIAASIATQALDVFPDHPLALCALARARAAQGKLDEAVTLFDALVRVAPQPEFFYDRAEALERAGRAAEAAAAFKDFERRALAVSREPLNANRELIIYDVDRAAKPGEALELARREMARRHDLATRDVFAWALFANGDVRAAAEQIDLALAVGARPASLLQHARAIKR